MYFYWEWNSLHKDNDEYVKKYGKYYVEIGYNSTKEREDIDRIKEYYKQSNNLRKRRWLDIRVITKTRTIN